MRAGIVANGRYDRQWRQHRQFGLELKQSDRSTDLTLDLLS
ncbi:hypothetical protein [Nostoc sp. TCL26-01]|nr:hypothetical protein [Nostoc sp. TCL26-01]